MLRSGHSLRELASDLRLGGGRVRRPDLPNRHSKTASTVQVLADRDRKPRRSCNACASASFEAHDLSTRAKLHRPLHTPFPRTDILPRDVKHLANLYRTTPLDTHLHTHCSFHFTGISYLVADLLNIIHPPRCLLQAMIVHKSNRIPIAGPYLTSYTQ